MKMLKESKANEKHKVEFQTMELIDFFDLWFGCYWQNIGGQNILENFHLYGAEPDYSDNRKKPNGKYTYFDLLNLMKSNKTMCKICKLIPKELDKFMNAKYNDNGNIPSKAARDWRYDCFKRFKKAVLKQKEGVMK